MRVRTPDGWADLPYLAQDEDRHGNRRLYVRMRGKPKIRIREREGTEAFVAAYRAARNGVEIAPRAPAGSLRWLAGLWYASGDFMALGERRRRVIRGILRHILDRHGEKPAALMEPHHVQRIMDEKIGKPVAANDRRTALHKLYAWGARCGYVPADPTRDVERIAHRTSGHHTWTVEEVQQFWRRHPVGTKAHLAVSILLYTGVRRSDVVGLGRQNETRDGRLRFVEVKGNKRKETVIPILPALRQALDGGPTGDLTYLLTAFGKPFTANGFGNWFKKRCREAGLPHCTAHGLRKAGATILANNGATEHQLMAIFGWESPKQAALYTRKANREKLAADAMGLLSVPLLPGGVPPSPGKAQEC